LNDGRAVNKEVIRFTLASGRSFSLLSCKDIGIAVLTLLVLVLLSVLCRPGGLGLFVHSSSGISCLGGCLDDLVEFSHRLHILNGQLLYGSFILTTLLEGHNHLIFNHIGIVLQIVGIY
jgi:hypothetical protein